MAKTGISNGSLYNMFTKDELLRKDVTPILNLLKLTFQEFLDDPKSGESQDEVFRLMLLEKENEFLKKQLEDKERIIELLKEKKTQKSTSR